MIEEIDEVVGAADIAAERADGLRQRAYLDVHAPMNVVVVDGAAAIATEHAGRVGVVHHHDGAVFLGQLADRGSAPMSPSMEKTPSVISSLWPGLFATSFSSSSACATSL